MVEKTSGGNDRPKSVDKLNAELSNEKVIYSPVIKQQVNAWYRLRTSADHANYNDYTERDVRNMLNEVRHFIGNYT